MPICTSGICSNAYLLKRAEVNRGSTPEIFVVNNHDQKSDAQKEQEKKRYQRLYRDPSKVVYTSLTFENFAKDPFGIGAKPRKEIEWAPPRAKSAKSGR